MNSAVLSARVAAAALGALLWLAVGAAHAALTLEANGQSGTVQVQPGEQVDLQVIASGCPGTASRWRDTWSDPDGIGVPPPAQEEFTTSVCQRGPSRSFIAPNSPGSSYDVTFTSESCRNGSFFGFPIPCPVNLFGGTLYEVFGSSTVTIEIVDAPSLLSEWRMDEAAWSGAAGEVIDSSGNARDGTAQNGAQTAGASPAIDADPGTCRYGVFDGNNDYVSVSGLSGILSGTATLTFWIRTTQGGNNTGWQAPGVAGVEQAGGSEDIFWGWIDAGGRIGISVANDFANDQKSSSAINDGNWHHVALTRNAGSGDTRVYVDGVLETSGNSGTGIIGTAFTSLGRIEDTGGSPEHLQGNLDEVRVYDAVLSDAQVLAVFNETRSCPAIGDAVAWYRLDELVYDGSAGEVLDASGNGNHARTLGSVTSYPADDADAQVCSGAIVSANTSTAAIDAIDTGVDVDAQLGARGSINFWYQSPERWQNIPDDRMLFDASTATGGGAKYFYLALVDATSTGNPANRGARIAFGLEDDDDDDFRFETAQLNFNQQTWVHIGVTWDLVDQVMRVFVNGAQVGSWNIPGASNVLGNVRTLYFGDNRGNQQVGPMTGNSATGRFDEIRLYAQAVDAAQMAADRDATHPCDAGGVDHYTVTHDGTAVSCGAEPITITARDSNGDPVDAQDASIALSTSTGEGTWARVISGSGALSGVGVGAGTASYTFPDNGESAVALAFNYTTVSQASDPEAVDFFVNAGDELPPGGQQLIVSRSGFRITDGGGNPVMVPAQIAGKSSDVAPGAASLALQAIRASDSDPSQCVPYFPDGGDVVVEIGAECNDPDSCAGIALQVSNNASTSSVATSNDNGGIGAAAYTPVTLRFDADAQAPLVLSYADAGAIQLHVRYNPIIIDTPPPPVVQYVIGSSNAWVTRPFGFDVAVAADDATTGAGGTVLAVAGDDVDTTVRAVTWQAGDDVDADGQPDAGADLADNPATPNFGNEDTPETVTLIPTVSAPAGGSDGDLTGAVFDNFTGGSETHGVSWDEVGHVHLNAALTASGYLSAGGVTGRAASVGRFIPADFHVAVAAHGDLDAGCAATFSYTGQPTGYVAAMQPRLTITARERFGDTTTNYRGSFAKLSANDIAVAGPAQDGTAIGFEGDPVALTSSLGLGALVANGDGTLTYTFSSADRFSYDKVHNARIDPFVPDLQLDVTAVNDGEAAADPSLLPLEVTPAAVHDIRFARLAIDAASGSELVPLEQPLRVQYWLAQTWQTNVADGCTTLTLAGEVSLDNDQDGPVPGTAPIQVGGGSTELTTDTADPLALVNGLGVLNFAGPGEGNTGWVDTTLTLDADLPWLRHDWDDVDGAGDGPYDALPAARATFGIFSGNRPWIHFRRVQ